MAFSWLLKPTYEIRNIFGILTILLLINNFVREKRTNGIVLNVTFKNIVGIERSRILARTLSIYEEYSIFAINGHSIYKAPSKVMFTPIIWRTATASHGRGDYVY